MNKKIVAAIIAALCIAAPSGVLAENSCADKVNENKQLDISKLSDSQKADLKAQLEKMLQLKKETIQKMVENGSITKEQGENMLQKLDEKLKSVQDGNLEQRKCKDNSEHKKNDKSPEKNKSKDKSTH